MATGFKPVGLIEVAADADRLHEYRRVASFQRRMGLEIHEITPTEMAVPPARTDDLLAGSMSPATAGQPGRPDDGAIRGARQHGATIVEGVRATGVPTTPEGRLSRVTGVATDAGDVEAEIVVNCAGMWAANSPRPMASSCPTRPPSTTTSSPSCWRGWSPDAPVFEDPAAYGYYREEGGGMMVGLFEPIRAPPRGASTASRATSPSARSRRLGPDDALPERDVPRLPVTRGRDPQILLRPGILHRRTCCPRSARPEPAAATSSVRD